MPEGRRRGLFPREGFTVDSITALVSRTLLNPALTLPLFLVARYTERGGDLAALYPNAARRLKFALIWGAIVRLSSLLGRAAQNNFTRDTYEWSKEIVVVTGGSDGIGKLIVQELAKKAGKVVVLDIQELTYEAPSNVTFYKCDLAAPDAIPTTCDAIKRDVGAPTVLINNAGITRNTSVLNTTATDLRLTFGVNTFAHYALAQAFLPHMIQRNHGMVVTVASLAAHFTAPGMVDYSASKAAAMAFHEGLATELATAHKADKVRTVLVCPGYVRTTLFAGLDEGDGFASYPLHPATVAERVVGAVLAGESADVFVPGFLGALARRVRMLPVWQQVRMRKNTAGIMKGFKGRMVVQPSEEMKEA